MAGPPNRQVKNLVYSLCESNIVPHFTFFTTAVYEYNAPAH